MHVVRSKDPFLFFSNKEKKRIVEAIRAAEKNTSGEIRVHLERKARPDFFEHAKDVFQRLGMTETELRNGVLIFIGIESKRFAILGDIEINNKVPAGFWDESARQMGGYFRADHFADGLVHAILDVGQKLRDFFPYQRQDLNELPDEISYSL